MIGSFFLSQNEETRGSGVLKKYSMKDTSGGEFAQSLVVSP